MNLEKKDSNTPRKGKRKTKTEVKRYRKVVWKEGKRSDEKIV